MLYSLLGRLTWMVVKRRLAAGASPLAVLPIIGAAAGVAALIARRQRSSRG